MTTHAWNPTDRDRLISRWVKFDGHKQSWVADQLDMNQSTVSRIVDRYERWIAHGGPAQQGALNRDERLRAQVWLTYERNESIIASCLRLAGEMERMSDTTRSTIKHYCSEPSREIEVRTENSIRDNTAKANSYLNLAHRVGENQLKLLEKYDLPALEPFTLDQSEYSQALADARSGFQSGNSPFESVPTDCSRHTPCAVETLARSASEGRPSSMPNDSVPELDLASSLHPSVSPSPGHDSMLSMHNQEPAQSHPTPAHTITSVEISPHKKPSVHAYASPQIPPEPTDQLTPILDATTHQPPPPIRLQIPLAIT